MKSPLDTTRNPIVRLRNMAGFTRTSTSTIRIASFSVLLMVLTWAVAAGSIWRSYEIAIQNWNSTAALGVEIARAFSAKSIAATDLVLKSMLDWISEEDVQTPDQFRQVFDQPRYFEKLRDRIGNVEQIDVATFIAKDGGIITFSRSYPQPGINLADRDYFKEQIRSIPPLISLGNVVQNRGTGRWTFYMAKQVRSRSGVILGVAIVGIEAEYFSDFFRKIVPSGDSSITFWRADGTILATSSDRAGLLGRRYPDAVGVRFLKAHPEGGSEWLSSPRLINSSVEQERIVAVRPLDNVPAFVTISIGVETILAGWRTERNIALGLALALNALILWASRQSLRYQTALEAREATERERRVVRAVVDMPLALTAVIDGEGRILLSNRNFRENFDHFIVAERLRIPDQNVAEVFSRFIGSDRESEVVEFAVSAVTGGRRSYRFALAKQVLRDKGPCVIIVGTDETERRAAELAIAQSSKMITLGEMATGMAHELNQPINIIHMAAQNALGEVQPLEPDEPTPAPTPEVLAFVTEKLDTILSQTRRAASLISHMRVFGRVPEQAPVPFDARQACTVAHDLVGQQIRTRGISLELALDERPAMVLGHQTLLEQVIVNLLVNARDAVAAKDDGERRIDLSCRAVDGRVVIEVRDSGPGVADAIRDRIFDPFFTTKEVGRGTGLGLAISYGIIKEMGGKIFLAPSKSGANFRIELPAHDGRSSQYENV